MPHQVRTHTRRTASGRTVTVHQHERRGGSVSPGHAKHLAHRAIRYGQRHKKGRAALFGVLAAGEILAWATLGGTVLALAAIAGSAGFLTAWLSSFSGTERKPERPSHDFWDDDAPEPAPKPVKPVKVNRAPRPPAASQTHEWPEEAAAESAWERRVRENRG
jgi:hypothetical protein